MAGYLIEFSLFSFVTVTFVIEAMASANAIITWRHIQHRKRVSIFRSTLTPTISNVEYPVDILGR